MLLTGRDLVGCVLTAGVYHCRTWGGCGWGLKLSPTCPIRGSTTTPFQGCPSGLCVLGAVVLLPTISVSLPGEMSGLGRGGSPVSCTFPLRSTSCAGQWDTGREGGGEQLGVHRQGAEGFAQRALDAASADHVHRALCKRGPHTPGREPHALTCHYRWRERQWTSASCHLPAPSSSSPSFPEVPHTCLHPRRDCYSGSQIWRAGHGLRWQQLKGTRWEQWVGFPQQSTRTTLQHIPPDCLIPESPPSVRGTPTPTLGKLVLGCITTRNFSQGHKAEP